MNSSFKIQEQYIHRYSNITRIVRILLTMILVVGTHWIISPKNIFLHSVHVIVGKSFLIPVLLAALWFGFSGALLTSFLMSLVYLPHILVRWGHDSIADADQISEVVAIWVGASIAGWLMFRERLIQRKLVQTHREILKALVKALDMREHDTQLHSLRVRAFTERIGREMKLPPHQLEEMARGALLHDIGKIGVPDAILLKRERLSREEWEIIKRHPEMGAEILRDIPMMEKTARMVLEHHEKYDGTGYPQRLRGKEISLGARIFAVADVFDALTSRRSYREPLSYEEARKRIEENAEKHFDPVVVAAFMRILPEEWEQIAIGVREMESWQIPIKNPSLSLFSN